MGFHTQSPLPRRPSAQSLVAPKPVLCLLGRLETRMTLCLLIAHFQPFAIICCSCFVPFIYLSFLLRWKGSHRQFGVRPCGQHARSGGWLALSRAPRGDPCREHPVCYCCLGFHWGACGGLAAPRCGLPSVACSFSSLTSFAFVFLAITLRPRDAGSCSHCLL